MGIDTAKNINLKIIATIFLVLVFIFINILLVQIVTLFILVYIAPIPLLSVFPIMLIYDAVSSGSRPFIFSIITIILILLFYILKPYIRR